MSDRSPDSGAFACLIHELTVTVDRLHQQAAADLGVAPNDLRALQVITPGGLSPTDLARALVLTTGSVTTLVDRLITRGYVRRVPRTDDRRGVVIELTASGRRTQTAAAKVIRTAAQQAIDRVAPTDLAVTERLLSQVLDHLREQVAADS